MIDLTASMYHVLRTIGNRSATAHELGVNGGVCKRLYELGFLKIDMPKQGYCPPWYSLSEKGQGAAAVLNFAPQPRDLDGPVAQIKRLVAEHYAIPFSEMVSARRSRRVARPRQIAMYLSKRTTPKSLPDIGRHFGNRDHTTVIHAIRKVSDLMEQDRSFRDEITALEGKLASTGLSA